MIPRDSHGYNNLPTIPVSTPASKKLLGVRSVRRQPKAQKKTVLPVGRVAIKCRLPVCRFGLAAFIQPRSHASCPNLSVAWIVSRHHRLGFQHRRRQMPGVRPGRQHPGPGASADRPVDRRRRQRTEPHATRRPGAGQHPCHRRPAARHGPAAHWVAGGISATHHTTGRIDADHNQVRRAICWNDHSLAAYHAKGLARLGGQERVQQLIGGPWAIRYSLSHLVKDEAQLAGGRLAAHRDICSSHGALAGGYLTGNFDVVSVSAAASTGIMDLRTDQWCKGMLGALENAEYRELAWKQLPRIVDHFEPIGQLSDSAGARRGRRSAAAAVDFPDVRRSASRPGRRRRGGRRADGDHPRQFRRGQFLRRANRRKAAISTP